MRNLARLVMALSVGLTCLAARGGEVFLSSAADFKAGSWNTASGEILNSKELPPNITDPDAPKSSIEYRVTYGGAFSYFTIEPTSKIPGRTTKVSFWAKVQKTGWTWDFKFRDEKGSDKNAKGKAYSMGLKLSDKWQFFEFNVKGDWPKQMDFGTIGAHNWGGQISGQKTSVSLYIYNMKVTTDVSGVKDQKALVGGVYSCTRPVTLFHPGEKVNYNFKLTNYLDEPVTGKISVKVTDPYGKEIWQESKAFEAKHSYTDQMSLEPKLFGSYRVDYQYELSNGNKQTGYARFAVVPEPRQLTNRQKIASPWGLNIHSGGVTSLSRYSGIGIVWVRDYNYNYGNVTQANRSNYSTWPWYVKMDQNMRESGLKLLVCFQGALKQNIPNAKQLTPEKGWIDELLTFAYRFAYYPAWELDNEYNLHNSALENRNNWTSYKAYHKLFADTFYDANFPGLRVEQGNAGVFPERTRQMIESGAFDNIDVINGHFYCGVTAPELMTEDRNAKEKQADTFILFDNLRNYKKAAGIDGKKREAWITEFGWDTLAGYPVSELEQYAYLQRGYLTGLGAGIDKMFWFYNKDAANPSVFFDGCGLYDEHDDPKPAAAAYAFMTKMLLKPEVIGVITPADNARGYVIKDEGKYLAVVYKLDIKGVTPTVSLTEGKLFDAFGNPLTKGNHELTLAPIWITGLTAESPLVKQARFSLKTPYYTTLSSGDSVEIEIANGNGGKFSAAMKLPKNWQVKELAHSKQALPAPAGHFKVASVFNPLTPELRAPAVEQGSSKLLQLSAPADLPPGTYRMPIVVKQGNVTRQLDYAVKVSQPAKIAIEPFNAKLGQKLKLRAKVRNNSCRTADFVVRPVLPQSWKAQGEVVVKKLASREERAVEFEIDWTAQWGENEQAVLQVLDERNVVVTSAGITPPTIELAVVNNLKLDGDFSDWPKAARLPDWLVGSTRIGAPVAMYLGYDTDGLYVGVKVSDSVVRNSSPKSFWNQDCLEIFVDSTNAKQDGKRAAQETQIWIVPDPDNNKVFAGHWESGSKEFTPAGCCKRIEGGYQYEIFIPTSEIRTLELEKGKTFGLNLNLSVIGHDDKYEVFWKSSKNDVNIGVKQSFWGTVVCQ